MTVSNTPPDLATIGVVNTGDNFVARAIRWFTGTKDQYGRWNDAKVNHAFIYVGIIAGYDEPQIVESNPGGAVFSPWNKYGKRAVWLTHLDESGTGLPVFLSPQNRYAIVSWARSFAIKKVGYSYLDIVAIALAQRRIGEPIDPHNPPWWVKRLADPRHLICSQLVDYAYEKAGVHLFSDGRLPGLVSPADLLSLKA